MTGILCPKCNAATEVRETRGIENGLRRRRVCSSVVCDGRVTTIELPAPADRRKLAGLDLVLVPRDALAPLARMLINVLGVEP